MGAEVCGNSTLPLQRMPHQILEIFVGSSCTRFAPRTSFISGYLASLLRFLNFLKPSPVMTRVSSLSRSHPWTLATFYLLLTHHYECAY